MKFRCAGQSPAEKRRTFGARGLSPAEKRRTFGARGEKPRGKAHVRFAGRKARRKSGSVLPPSGARSVRRAKSPAGNLAVSGRGPPPQNYALLWSYHLATGVREVVDHHQNRQTERNAHHM